jgi:hypothetical protein
VTFGRSTSVNDKHEVNACSLIDVTFGKLIFTNEQQSKNAFIPVWTIPEQCFNSYKEEHSANPSKLTEISFGNSTVLSYEHPLNEHIPINFNDGRFISTKSLQS